MIALAEPIIEALRNGFAKPEPEPQPEPESEPEPWPPVESLVDWLARLSDVELAEYIRATSTTTIYYGSITHPASVQFTKEASADDLADDVKVRKAFVKRGVRPWFKDRTAIVECLDDVLVNAAPEVKAVVDELVRTALESSGYAAKRAKAEDLLGRFEAYLSDVDRVLEDLGKATFSEDAVHVPFAIDEPCKDTLEIMNALVGWDCCVGFKQSQGSIRLFFINPKFFDRGS
jgi:hypothetical protein